ncbi:MAG: hypothetical protein U9Q99_00375 [Nanoarchaeota archaeon]|nr:hypothetical protein [Nanoarchaeota archaeon]
MQVFLDLIPIARKELLEERKKSYRNCPEFYHNNGLDIKQLIREIIQGKAILKLSEEDKEVTESYIPLKNSEKDLDINYEMLNFLTINKDKISWGNKYTK